MLGMVFFPCQKSNPSMAGYRFDAALMDGKFESVLATGSFHEAAGQLPVREREVGLLFRHGLSEV
jgi:hypothetical protein